MLPVTIHAAGTHSGASVTDTEARFGTLTMLSPPPSSAHWTTSSPASIMSTSQLRGSDLATSPGTPNNSDTAKSSRNSDLNVSTNSSSLRTLMEDLPQEIYDRIHDLVFHFDFTSPKTRCVDRRSYKPILQLQMNKALRSEYIQQYYGAKESWTSLDPKPGSQLPYRGYSGLGCNPVIGCHQREAKAWLETLSEEAINALPLSDPLERDPQHTWTHVWRGRIKLSRIAVWFEGEGGYWEWRFWRSGDW